MFGAVISDENSSPSLRLTLRAVGVPASLTHSHLQGLRLPQDGRTRMVGSDVIRRGLLRRELRDFQLELFLKQRDVSANFPQCLRRQLIRILKKGK